MCEPPPTPKNIAYLSFDIEANGPFHPDKFTAMEYGFALLDPSKFRANDPSCLKDTVVELKSWAVAMPPGEESDPATMAEFWNRPALRPNYDKLVKEGRPLAEVMREFNSWLNDLKTRYDWILWIASPISYDAPWLLRDFYRVIEDSRLPYSMKCISTALDTARRMLEADASHETGRAVICDRRAFAEQINVFKIEHDHVAERDALKQGLEYCAHLCISAKKSTIRLPEAASQKSDGPIKGVPQLVFYEKCQPNYG